MGQSKIVFFMNRIFRVCLLAVALLGGALERHSPGELHGGLAACRQGVYSRSARHPNAPAHFEATEDYDCPLCPFCLHHLRTGAARLSFAALLAAPSLTELRGPSHSPLAGKCFAAPSGARGPPSV